MVCDVVQFNRIEAAEGNSGSRPDCVATSAAFFLGEFPMKCGHETCPLLEISLIPLTQGKYAIVDIEDYKWLMRWKWCARREKNIFYAARHERFFGGKKKRRRTIFMHRMILNTPKGLQSDHENHNGIDNRKCNLRTCNAGENCRNRLPSRRGTSWYKGVYFKKVLGKFGAQIMLNGKTIHLGYYKSEIEAAKAYDAKAIELFGEFACLNFAEKEKNAQDNTQD